MNLKTKTESINALILSLIEQKKYFSVSSIRHVLVARHLHHSPTTIKQYLYNLKSRKIIFDAGYGWYSSIDRAFELDTESIEDIVALLKKRFPFLPFSYWSTAQVKYFVHHLMTKFTGFVYTDPDVVPSVTDVLKEHEYDAYQNPTRGEVMKYFTPSLRGVIVRPLITEEPAVNHFAQIEKILVDLFIEKDRVNLMDGSEYERIFRNIILDYRINIPRMLRYAERRHVKKALIGLLKKEKTILAE